MSDPASSPEPSATSDPAGTSAATDATIDRRAFFERICYGVGALGAAIVGIPAGAFVLAPFVENEPPQWQAVGEVAKFTTGETVRVIFEDPSPLPWAGVTARSAAWLRRTGDAEFIAFSVNCSHLGCPVRWLPDADLFMCPCHGGVYYNDGSVAAGPPPHPLPRYEVRVNGDQVEIQCGGIPITTV